MDKLLHIQQNSVNAEGARGRDRERAKFSARDVPYIPIWYQQVAMALKSKYALRLRHVVPVHALGGGDHRQVATFAAAGSTPAPLAAR